MDEKTFWLVEMTDIDNGDEHHAVFDSPEKLGDYVRVNARDAAVFRIASANEFNLVNLRIGEAFSDGD